MPAETDLDIVVRHDDRLVARLGETRVGSGSDFDGAVVPERIGSVSGSQTIFRALSARGYGGDILRRIAIETWLRVLGEMID